MRPAEIERMKELLQRVTDAKSEGLYAVSLDDSLELERLLRKEIAEREFGFPICGEE